MSQIRSFCKRQRKQRRESQSGRDCVRALRLSLPDPETLDDGSLSERLWRALEQLARMQVVLLHTDHLSDRELYTRLGRDVLQERTWPTAGRNEVHMIDMAMGESRQALEDFLSYYADDQTRRYFVEQTCDISLPERKPLPFDRERRLASLQS
jgi:hypothetical protein